MSEELARVSTFSFSWKIENLHLWLAKTFNEHLKSPVFTVQALDKTAWSLTYCSGENILLNRKDNDPEIVSVQYQVTISLQDGSYKFTTDTYKHEFGKASSKSIRVRNFQDILEENSGILHGQTWTINCRMWRDEPSRMNLKSLVPDDFSVDSGVKLSDFPEDMCPVPETIIILSERTLHPFPTSCTGFTRVNLKRVLSNWNIEQVSTLQSGMKTHKLVYSSTGLTPQFLLTLYLDPANKDDVCVEIQNVDKDQVKTVFCLCDISLLNSEGKIHHSKSSTFSFEPGEEDKKDWMFQSFIRWSQLVKEKDVLYPSDKLTLLLDFTVTDFKYNSHIESSNDTYFETQETAGIKSCSSNLMELYSSGKCCDVTLETSHGSLEAHMAVLCAMSPVFLAMFQTSMTEKESLTVSVPDVDMATMKMFLRYLYSEQLDTLQESSVSRLFYVANKYQVMSLRNKCSLFLRSCLSLGNVCEILILADTHEDRGLLDFAKMFVRNNKDEILESKDWELFSDANTKLANQVLTWVCMQLDYKH